MLKYFGLAFCVAFVASASVPELADGEDFELRKLCKFSLELKRSNYATILK